MKIKIKKKRCIIDVKEKANEVKKALTKKKASTISKKDSIKEHVEESKKIIINSDKK